MSSYSSLQGRKFLLPAVVLLSILAAIVTTSSEAQDLSDHRLREGELWQFDADLAREIDMLRHRDVSDEEYRSALRDLLERDGIPEEIRWKIRVKLAAIEQDIARQIEIYESLLDDSDPAKDANIRGRLMTYVHQGNGSGDIIGFGPTGTFHELKQKLDRIAILATPLLALATQDSTTETMFAIAHYAGILRQTGSGMASRVLKVERFENDTLGGSLMAAQVRIHFRRESERIVTELLEVVEVKIVEQGAPSREPDPDGQIDDPLWNLRGGLQYQLNRPTARLERDVELLRANGQSPDSEIAKSVIESIAASPPE